MPSSIIPDRIITPPIIEPFLHVLGRMQDRIILRPAQLTDRARALLSERFGSSPFTMEATFAHGGIGLLGEHTHYFDGFAVLLTLPFGTAAAVRETTTQHSRIVFQGRDETYTVCRSEHSEKKSDHSEKPSWTRVVEELVFRLVPEHTEVDIAVVSTVNASCMDVYLSALGVAVARSVQALFALPHNKQQLLTIVRDVIEVCLDMPYSIALPIAADVGKPEAYTLVDTFTFEQLPLDAPTREMLGWGMVNLGTNTLYDPSFYRRRKEQADEAVYILQHKTPLNITSLRDIEHRELQLVLDVLPRRLRRIVRHLVTENRRVQKLVTAVQRRDWQMFGALLLMSHASLRNDWESTVDEVDLVVDLVEGMSIEGMYGACMTSRGGCVLVVGQPFIVPQCLDRIRASLIDQIDTEPDTVLL